MTIPIAATVAAIAAMLFGTLALGLDNVPGRIVAGIGIVLLWVPISALLARRRRRREASDSAS